MCLVALFQSYEHPPNLVRGNIFTRRLVDPAPLLGFMLIYFTEYLLWIVDYQNEYSSSALPMYSRYAAFFEDSAVQHLPVDGLWSHNLNLSNKAEEMVLL